MEKWPYHSHNALVRAGFLFRCEADCHRCPARVLIYGKPDGRSIALEFESFKPHRWRCPPRPKRATGPKQEKLFAA